MKVKTAGGKAGKKADSGGTKKALKYFTHRPPGNNPGSH